MSEPLPVVVTDVAAELIREADTWWRTNRTAARVTVWQEVQQAFVAISSEPRVGSRAHDVVLPNVQRIFLPVIKYYLYYRVLSNPDRVEILALWHRRRGTRPPI